MQTLEGYEIDTDPARVDRDRVWHLLVTLGYWSRWRVRAVFDDQLDTAWRVAAAYDSTGRTVGFARAISDGWSTAYLSDVIVDPDHRGRGIGRALVGELTATGPGAALRWLLHTDDAHDLYRQFGFAPVDGRVMEKPRPAPGDDPWERDVAAVWSGDLPDDEILARMTALAAQRRGTAEAAYELASAHDAVGDEWSAEPLYRDALARGLDADRAPRAVIQLASTLRNLGRPSDALDLLEQPADQHFDDVRAAFSALALLDLGRDREAALLLLTALAGRLPEYGRSVTAYAEELAAGPRSSES